MKKVLNQDEKYMRMCFKLAQKGKGNVSPNPMVGCVVLDKNNNVVSKGYHKKYGENHAERDALLKLHKNEAEGGTLYVNLEPCSHYGKTPPCVDIILEHKLARVVYAIKDVNPKVNSSEKLKQAGIEVTEGVLENEARFLNRIFFKNMTKKLPYVVLKTATTMDGKICTFNKDSKWITSEESRKYVYELRKEFDCIMTSSNTILADNPKMEHRFKCVLDTNAKIPNTMQIFKQGNIFHATKFNTPLKNGKLDILNVLQELYKKGICSVWIECGSTLAGSLLKDGLIDEIYQFIAPKILNDNSGFSCFNGEVCNKIENCHNLEVYDIQKFSKDILIKALVL